MSNIDDAEGFEWDDECVENGNTAHLARHAITQSEAEQAFYNAKSLARGKRRLNDWRLVGITDGGRAHTLIMSYSDARRLVRIFTGWGLHARRAE